ALGGSTFPAAAASAPAMGDFFGASSTPTPTPTPTPAPTPAPSTGACAAAGTGVTVCSPLSGTTTGSPVAISAAAAGGTISAMAIYVDNSLAYKVNAASVDTQLSMATGSHNIVVQAWTTSGTVYKKSVSVTV